MITPRALCCTSLVLALALGGCGDSEEHASGTSATGTASDAPSPFDVAPQGVIRPETTNAMPPRMAAPTGGASATIPNDGSFRAAGIVFAVPEGWTTRTPSSSMRAAELAIPSGVEGVEDGVLAVFGSIGGTVEQNIGRWVGQMSGMETPPQRDTREVGALTVHTVIATGTYDPGMMTSNTGPQADTTLIGAVITGGPGGPVFLKATGPKGVIASNLDGWEALIASASAG